MAQNTGKNRNSIDKFYTKDIIVKQCMDVIERCDIIKKNDIIIEPSAGNGAFINYIKKLTDNYIFLDIEPENEEIKKQDYLNYKINIDEKKNYHIVGNPPFGKQASLARKFIKKSCEFAQSISFILPKSFKKQSMQKTFSLKYHLIYEKNIQENSFLVNNKEYNVPCVFQIWIKKDSDRQLPEEKNEINYKFVKKNEEPHISVRRVGVYAGKISKEIETKNINSHYFVKFHTSIDIDNIIEKLNTIKFEFDNTVGAKSISKQEIIKEYNKWTCLMKL